MIFIVQHCLSMLFQILKCLTLAQATSNVRSYCNVFLTVSGWQILLALVRKLISKTNYARVWPGHIFKSGGTADMLPRRSLSPWRSEPLAAHRLWIESKRDFCKIHLGRRMDAWSSTKGIWSFLPVRLTLHWNLIPPDAWSIRVQGYAIIETWRKDSEFRAHRVPCGL